MTLDLLCHIPPEFMNFNQQVLKWPTYDVSDGHNEYDIND